MNLAESRLTFDETGSVIGVDTRELSWDEQYKLITSLVIPRPIALVSTDGPAGRNAAPFSFFNAIALGPPMMMFCIGPNQFSRVGEVKDTMRNVQATREFVIQIVDDSNKERMNACAPEYGAEIDEMAISGFRTAESMRIRAPRIIDCPVQFECVLTDIHKLGEGSYSMVVGEVVYAHFASGLVNERLRVDLDKLNPIGRLSSPGWYTRVTDRFQMMPPPIDTP
jgi:flavin reductase (DIM6/NTAB) family NADH-FMN oxidoreductase RutF